MLQVWFTTTHCLTTYGNKKAVISSYTLLVNFPKGFPMFSLFLVSLRTILMIRVRLCVACPRGSKWQRTRKRCGALLWMYASSYASSALTFWRTATIVSCTWSRWDIVRADDWMSFFQHFLMFYLFYSVSLIMVLCCCLFHCVNIIFLIIDILLFNRTCGSLILLWPCSLLIPFNYSFFFCLELL